MSRFKQKGGKEVPAISTSSLPDIIFMLLFFFMVTTTMRQADVLVRNNLPQATDVQKLEKKSLVSFVYVGPPTNKKFGTESRIQLNDRFATVEDIQEFIFKEREARNEADKKKLITSLKVDKETKMGVVTDIKQELRQANALKVAYSSNKKTNLK
ncbi:MAG: biopolymer transporter ExbD [Clostridia bacterium]|nr:biopolymer transporter ExbD [Clostridia bacterium]